MRSHASSRDHRAQWMKSKACRFVALAALTACDPQATTTGLVSPVDAVLVIVSGDAQSGEVGTDLQQPLVVRAIDSKGKPISDLAIQFEVIQGGGRVYSTESITGATGDALNYWTLGTTAGTQRVEARTVDPASGSRVLHGSFTATATAGPATGLTVAGQLVPSSVTEGTVVIPGVKVLDQFGNPVAGTPVTFTTSAGSSVLGGITATQSNGVASPGQWVVGPDSQTLTAVVSAAIAVNTIVFQTVGTGRWRSVASGQKHSCALDENSRAYCWGANSRGQLGIGSSTSAALAMPVVGDRSFDKLSVGWEHTCGIETTTRRLYCWGRNDQGNLGDGTVTDRVVPSLISMPPGAGDQVVDVAAGGGHTCAIASTGGTFCTGWGGYGILGNASEASSLSLTPIAGTHSFVSVKAGISHTCGLTVTGSSWCWGFGWYGELGTNGNLDPQAFYSAFSATPVLTSQLFAQLELGGNYSCGLRAVGDVLCWGENRFGQLGTQATHSCAGSIPCNPTPVSAAPWQPLKRVSLGRARLWNVSGFGSSVHTCGVDFSNNGLCWGSNDAGQLGTGATSVPQLGPQAVRLPAGANSKVSSFANGYRHTCLLSFTFQIWCVGENAEGQLAAGDLSAFRTGFNRVAHP